MITKTRLDHPSFWHRTLLLRLPHQVKIVHKDVPYEVPGTPKIIPVKLPQQVGGRKEVKFTKTPFFLQEKNTSQLFFFLRVESDPNHDGGKKDGMVIFYQFLLFFVLKSCTYYFWKDFFLGNQRSRTPPQSVRVIYNTWSFPYQKPTCLGFSPPWVTHHEVIYKTRVQMVPKLIKVEQPSKTVYVKKPVPHHVHPKPIYEKVPVVDKDSYDCNQGFLDDGIGLLLGVFWSFFLWVKRCVG